MDLLEIINIVELGLIYGIISVGVYLSFRVINFSDLTVDGSLMLGGAVTAICICQEMSPWTALIMGSIAGGIAGGITGMLNTKLGITDLLAGILVMTGLYSVSLRIMGGPNVGLFNYKTIFEGEEWDKLYTLGGISLIIVGGVMLMLKTNWGLGIRSIGSNCKIAKSLGVNVNRGKVIVLMISNGLIGLGGGLLAEFQAFADISMGFGTVVGGLAAVIIGEVCLKKWGVIGGILGAVMGAIMMRLLVAVGLNASNWGLKSSDLNLIMSVIIVMIISFPKVKSYYQKLKIN